MMQKFRIWSFETGKPYHLVKYFNPSYHSKHRFRKLFTHKGKAWQTPEDFVYTASEKE